MPIYTYKCGACRHVKDVLQKISDPTTLTVCPECGAHSFAKQISAASFHLKGSGWYVTDFRDKGNQAEPAAGANKENSKPGVKSEEQGKNKTQAQSDTSSSVSDKGKDNSTAKVVPATTAASPTTSS